MCRFVERLIIFIAGEVTVFAGATVIPTATKAVLDGPAQAVNFYDNRGICFSLASAAFFVADAGAHAVRKIKDSMVTPQAITCSCIFVINRRFTKEFFT